MKYRVITRCVLCLPVALMLYSQAASSAVDAAAAEELAKKEGCLKCHGIDKKKEGRSLQEIGTSFKGKADADAKIYEHLTTGPKVKFEDGTTEEHKIIKTKDKAAINNLIAWIRSLAK